MQTSFSNQDRPANKEGIRNGKKCAATAFLASLALAGALTGCVGYVEGPRPVVQDDYVYYPDYQVYYSSNRRQYVYLDGRSWVTRSAPPRVSAEVLFAGPSVRLGFHDSPALHHRAVVRQYPKHWAPPGPEHGHNGHDGHNSSPGAKRGDNGHN